MFVLLAHKLPSTIARPRPKKIVSTKKSTFEYLYHIYGAYLKFLGQFFTIFDIFLFNLIAMKFLVVFIPLDILITTLHKKKEGANSKKERIANNHITQIIILNIL